MNDILAIKHTSVVTMMVLNRSGWINSGLCDRSVLHIEESALDGSAFVRCVVTIHHGGSHERAINIIQIFSSGREIRDELYEQYDPEGFRKTYSRIMSYLETTLVAEVMKETIKWHR